MQRSLFLLFLMGQCSFFTCHLYEYHFIKMKKAWDKAKEHCQKNFTDLATVSDMTDMSRLLDISANATAAAWIGLKKGDPPGMWHWSLPGVEYRKNESWWSEVSQTGQDNCVLTQANKLTGCKCDEKKQFICYNETKISDQKFHVIRDLKNWPDAQHYCRHRHTDLVSGFMQLGDTELKNKISGDQESLWIGLFRDTWRWSNGAKFSLRKWSKLFQDSNSKRCAMAVLRNSDSATWGSDNCSHKKTFFCYDDKVILIKQNKTWEEALYYCREHYSDLVSITSAAEQRWVQQKVSDTSTEFVWLGLRYTCTLDFWFWVSDEVVHYKNWDSQEQHDDMCDMSGAMKRGEHKWFKRLDNNTFYFMCSKP